MAQKRRKFSPQFKAEAVQFVLETGRPIAEIARELEVNEGTLGNWVNEWKRENPEPEKALTPVERARVAETLAVGTHLVLIGQVVATRADRNAAGAPLVYANQGYCALATA